MRKAISLAVILWAGAAYAENWDPTVPPGTEARSRGDNRIREMKAAIESALSWSGVFPGTNPATAPLYQWTLSYGLAAARPTDSVQDGQVYHSTDSGSIDLYTSGSWSRIGVSFPSGTKTLFYQASCPAGWTGVGTSVDDKFVRAVTTGTTGGATGGTVAASTSLAHSHTVADHSHTISASGTHTHTVGTGADTQLDASASGNLDMAGAPHTHAGTSAAGGDHNHGGATGSDDSTTDSQLGVFARADAVVCVKD